MCCNQYNTFGGDRVLCLDLVRPTEPGVQFPLHCERWCLGVIMNFPVGVLKTLWGVIRNLKLVLSPIREALRYWWGAQCGLDSVCQVPAPASLVALFWWLTCAATFTQGCLNGGVWPLPHSGSGSRTPWCSVLECAVRWPSQD